MHDSVKKAFFNFFAFMLVNNQYSYEELNGTKKGDNYREKVLKGENTDTIKSYMLNGLDDNLPHMRKKQKDEIARIKQSDLYKNLDKYMKFGNNTLSKLIDFCKNNNLYFDDIFMNYNQSYKIMGLNGNMIFYCRYNYILFCEYCLKEEEDYKITKDPYCRTDYQNSVLERPLSFKIFRKAATQGNDFDVTQSYFKDDDELLFDYLYYHTVEFNDAECEFEIREKNWCDDIEKLIYITILNKEKSPGKKIDRENLISICEYTRKHLYRSIEIDCDATKKGSCSKQELITNLKARLNNCLGIIKKETSEEIINNDLDYKPSVLKSHTNMNDNCEPAIKLIIYISNKLNCSIDYLMGLKGNKEIPIDLTDERFQKPIDPVTDKFYLLSLIDIFKFIEENSESEYYIDIKQNSNKIDEDSIFIGVRDINRAVPKYGLMKEKVIEAKRARNITQY